MRHSFNLSRVASILLVRPAGQNIVIMSDAGSIAGGWCLTITPEDTTPPDTTLATHPSDPSNSSSASFSLSGSDNVTPAASLSFECKLDAGAFATCTSPQSYSGLADGSHTFQVRAIDGANNTDSTPASFTWTIDTVRPEVTINQAAGQTDPTDSVPINFTVIFNEPVTGFTSADVTLSGTASATTALVTGSGTTYNVAVSGITSIGTVIASIPLGVATDAAGNGNAASTSADSSVTVSSIPHWHVYMPLIRAP